MSSYYLNHEVSSLIASDEAFIDLDQVGDAVARAIELQKDVLEQEAYNLMQVQDRWCNKPVCLESMQEVLDKLEQDYTGYLRVDRLVKSERRYARGLEQAYLWAFVEQLKVYAYSEDVSFKEHWKIVSKWALKGRSKDLMDLIHCFVKKYEATIDCILTSERMRQQAEGNIKKGWDLTTLEVVFAFYESPRFKGREDLIPRLKEEVDQLLEYGQIDRILVDLDELK